MADKTSMAAVLQFTRDVDVKHDGGHKRLRGDLDRTDQRILHLDTAQQAILARIVAVEAKANAPDVSTLVMSTKQVVAVVVACCSFAGFGWAINYQLNDLKQQQAMVRTKVEGLERSVATLMGRLEEKERVNVKR